MRRADRLFAIVQILRRARAPISAQRIADELETSKRSIYRDVAALIAQRVPIRGEASVGYVLERGFDMPPLMLVPDELDAAVLGAHWVATRAEPELARAARNLIAKLEAVIPAHMRPAILEPATSVAPIDAQPAELISSADLRRAVRSGHKLAIGYRRANGATSERTVWPVLLGYRDAGRILAAYCELRADFRYFRTERMTFARVLPQRFPERPSALRARWRQAMDEERVRFQRGRR
ncbi:MAG TPA: YafY family protein [Polyangiales bacterium]|nr:YafY family protein [Polyangiales bacterium]